MIKEFTKIEIKNEKDRGKYLKRGYCCKINDTINYPINELSFGSHIIVDVICDFCGKEMRKQYNVYNRETDFGKKPSCCIDCKNKKRKLMIENEYGVDNISQLKETKEKVKETIKKRTLNQEKEIKKKRIETNRKKFGIDWFTQSNDFKEKSKITSKIKYGTEYPNQSEIIKEKSKITNNEKYGKNFYMSTNDFKEKSKKRIKEKYGVEYASQSDEVKNKVKKTNLDRFGVEYPSKLKKMKEKTKKTNLVKYGYSVPSKSKQIKDKIKDTNLKRYNALYYSQSSEYKDKVKKRKTKNLSNKYSIDIKNIGNDGIIEVYCKDCKKTFKTTYQLLLNRYNYKTILCTNCNPIDVAQSGHEAQLLNFINENCSENITQNNRNIIKPYEIDIYLPDLKLGFEFNGLYWHNELYTDNNYHFNKTEECEKQGIKLIHIYEDDWLYKQEIVKSRILNLLNKTPNKIYARKCQIKEVTDNKLIREFLETNHIQGFVGSKVKIGLFYQEELVSLMTFGDKRKSMGQKSFEGSYEMLRFCNRLNTNVVGGASRLFKYFVQKHGPKEVISYADRSWSQGELYEKLGFKLIHKTKPNYYYIIDRCRKHRFNYRKDKLVKEGFDQKKTEHEIMLERGIYRIYDSGNLKYKLSL